MILAENLVLSDAPLWRSYHADSDEVVWVQCLATGDAATKSRQALVMFEFDRPATAEALAGSELSLSNSLGPYVYLETGAGPMYSDFIVKVPTGFRLQRIAIRNWQASGVISLHHLTVRRVSQMTGELGFTISVDVEALPARAPEDHVRRLIYGEYQGQEYGIRKLAELFSEYNIKATFMVDYAECALYGDDPLFKVGEILEESGHEVQLHMHSELIIRQQKWVVPTNIIPGFASLNYMDAKRTLEYGMEKFEKNLGRLPSTFRSGGYHFNKEMLLAAQSVGLKATTNLRNNSHYFKDQFWPSTGDIFKWESDILEIPVDLSLDPLQSLTADRFTSTLRRLTSIKKMPYFNMVLHSYSLFARDANGYASEPDPVHEKNLRAVLEFLSSHGKSVSYTQLQQLEFPALLQRLPAIAQAQGTTPSPMEVGYSKSPSSSFHCNICGTTFREAPSATESCPHCQSRPRQRALRWLFDSMGYDPFFGKRVISCCAGALEQKAFLKEALSVVNIVPVSGPDGVVAFDPAHLADLPDGGFESLLASHVLNRFDNDVAAVAEMARVLASDGELIATVPYNQKGFTETFEKVEDDFGLDTLEKYGIGSYRCYDLGAFVEMVRRHFDVTTVPAFDPLTHEPINVMMCKKYEAAQCDSET